MGVTAMSERDRLIEAMARSMLLPSETLADGVWKAVVKGMDGILIAIAEQGYAVVPRVPQPTQRIKELLAGGDYGSRVNGERVSGERLCSIISAIDIAKAEFTP